MKKQLCGLFLLFSSITVQAGNITTTSTIAYTMQALPQCTQYKIKGFCIWLSPLSGETTTPYIEQYLPDVVVTVYNKPGDDPWTEVNAIIDNLSKIPQQTEIKASTKFDAGSGQTNYLDEHDQSLFFKEVDVIGNPALALLPHGIFLNSVAVPMMPYFQSMVDSIMWRGLTAASLPEEAATFLTDIKYHVGKFPLNWGSIYPHQGSVVGIDDAVVAEVIAMRAAHLLTLPPMQRFGHLVESLATDCGKACNAATILPNDEDTQFQRIYPNAETSCHVLGSSINETSGLSNQTNGAYAWILWRKYDGCIDGDGILIDKVIF